ncbi:MAG: flap endonuclease-1 [Candidatus Nanohaloarchaea archaeon]|nr:flap endonuclease-1 [Candidatus Nanohaloarchaea archaeon]
MGSDLGDLIETEEISFKEMNDRKIGIDAMNTLYQFLSIIRQRDGTPLKDSSGQVTSHLSGLFYRTGKLLRKNIKPLYIFDGEAPELKSKEAKERRKKREKAREEWKQLKKEGKMKKAYKKATQSSRLTEDMVVESKKLLDAMGVPYIQAPSEGEAQAAWMSSRGMIWAVGGQDWDSILFGADRLVRNLTITGKRKVPGKKKYRKVVPEKIESEEALEQLGIGREKLIWIAIMIGTDFDPGGVKGIGPKTAIDLVEEHDSFEDLLGHEKLADWEPENDPHSILEFFMDPPIDESVDFEFGSPDRDQIVEVLVDQHDFSEDRVNSTAEKIEESMKESQKGLGNYL